MKPEQLLEAVHHRALVGGREARREGKKLSDSPFPSDHYLSEMWRSGWCDEDQVIINEEASNE